MRVLIPHNLGGRLSNPFVRNLRDGLTSCGHEVICSKEIFWESPLDYDLIFFQWPESIIDKKRLTPSLKTIEEQIRLIKSHNIPISITCHNLHPHNNSKFINDVYNCLYSQADIFHHMGDYSLQQMQKCYPKAFHFIASHPAFYNLKSSEVKNTNKFKALYGIPQDKITIMAFGAFRNSGEREMIEVLAKYFDDNVLFWAPKLYRDTYVNKNIWTRTACIYRYIKYSFKGIKMQITIPSDDEVMPMICASDILFIQRREILNSGNLPLGFSAGKIVVGPDKGNVGILLRETGNPVFNPQDNHSIICAVQKSIEMIKEGNSLGINNYEYAQNHLQPMFIAKKISDNIERAIEKK